jgi:hypothetical protein
VAHRFLWSALSKEKKYREAVETARGFLALQGYRASADALSSTFEEGGYSPAMRRAAAALAEQKRKSHRQGGYLPAIHIARLFAHAGDKDKALGALEEAMRERSPSMASLNVDPDWDVLRGSSGYEELLRRLRLPR